MNNRRGSLLAVCVVASASLLACGTSPERLSAPVEESPFTATDSVLAPGADAAGTATGWSISAVAAAQAASGGLRIGADCDSGSGNEPPSGELAFTTFHAVGRIYGDDCLVIAWGLAVNPNTSPSLDLPASALEAVEQVRRNGLAPLLLFDDAGNYVGNEIEAVSDPPEAADLAG